MGEFEEDWLIEIELEHNYDYYWEIEGKDQGLTVDGQFVVELSANWQIFGRWMVILVCSFHSPQLLQPRPFFL